ncbi:hypothetical protein [Paenibacillus lemnae]|nr:hypothetical protein [Paenibacillus lemnae]
MRDEFNRSTFGDMVRRQYETMDPVDPLTDIPEDETRDLEATTSQSLSSEQADHSGFSQDEAGPADGELGKHLNPDASSLQAWDATGAERSSIRLAEDLPVQTSSSLGEDANTTYPDGAPRYNPSYNRAAAEIDEDPDLSNVDPDLAVDNDPADAEDVPLEDVPDADVIQSDSPVDPSVPEDPDQHGIDVLNGAGGAHGDTERKLPEDF